MLTSSSTNSKEYFEGSFSPKSTTSSPPSSSSLLSTLQLESANGTFTTKLPEIPNDSNDNNRNLVFLGTIQAGTMTNPLGMTLKPPPENGNNANNNNNNSGPGSDRGTPKRGSRLDLVQAQYRQKLESEKEMKLRGIFEKSRQDADRRIERITGGVGANRKTPPSKAPTLAIADDSTFLHDRKSLEKKNARNRTELPKVETHAKNKRREYQQQQQLQQQRSQFNYEPSPKPTRHQQNLKLPGNAKNKPLSPIAPIPDARQLAEHNSNNSNNRSFNETDKSDVNHALNSTFSLSSASALQHGSFPPSPISPPSSSQDLPPSKTLLPPVKMNRRRSPANNDKDTAPRKLPQVQKKSKATTDKNALNADNMKFLDKILEAERRKSARRRHNRGEDPHEKNGAGDAGVAAELKDANCPFKRREEEIMRQINQKMAELDSLRSQNQDLGDRSRGSSRGGGSPLVSTNVHVITNDNRQRSAHHRCQTGKDSAADFQSHDEFQAAGQHDSWQNDDEEEEEQQKLTLGSSRERLSSSSSARRPRVAQLRPSSKANPFVTAMAAPSSSTSSPRTMPPSSPNVEIDPFRSRPRVGTEEQNKRPLTTTKMRRGNENREETKSPAVPAAVRREEEEREVEEERSSKVVGSPTPEEMPLKGGDSSPWEGANGGAKEAADMRLVECGNCGRRFAEDRVGKHEKACGSQKARKQYNMKNHRVQGQDHAAYALNEKYQKTEPKKESNWRAKREEFIINIRNARKGGSAAPAAVNPDYIQCPHCQRRFNEAAAQRHIPKCKDLGTKSVGQQRSTPKNGNSARTIAKPPSNTRRR